MKRFILITIILSIVTIIIRVHKEINISQYTQLYSVQKEYKNYPDIEAKIKNVLDNDGKIDYLEYRSIINAVNELNQNIIKTKLKKANNENKNH